MTHQGPLLPGESILHRKIVEMRTNVCDARRQTGYNRLAIAPLKPACEQLPAAVKLQLAALLETLDELNVHDPVLKSAIAERLGRTWQQDIDRFNEDFENLEWRETT